jgi:hypothetical protein
MHGKVVGTNVGMLRILIQCADLWHIEHLGLDPMSLDSPSADSRQRLAQALVKTKVLEVGDPCFWRRWAGWPFWNLDEMLGGSHLETP